MDNPQPNPKRNYSLLDAVHRLKWWSGSLKKNLKIQSGPWGNPCKQKEIFLNKDRESI